MNQRCIVAQQFPTNSSNLSNPLSLVPRFTFFKMAGNNLYKYSLAAGLGLAALIEHENLDILYNTLSRDVRTMATYAKIIFEYKKLQRLNKTVPDYFYDTVQTYGDKPMIIFAETEEVWTFNDVNKMSNQVAHFLIQSGYKRGDAVALFMPNQPKYMVALLGLAKIGVTLNLRGRKYQNFCTV